MAEEFNDDILKAKESKFEEFVELASKTFGLKYKPRVEFYDGFLPGGEIAHIELETQIIRVSRKHLKEMPDEKIKETAFHEVTHLFNASHDTDFRNKLDDVTTGTWKPPPGVIAIDGNIRRDEPRDTKKKTKQKPDKIHCNLCGTKSELKKCPYCSRYFCEEHFAPLPPSMPNFDYPSKFNEWKNRGENHHPCPNYYDFLVEEEKERRRKYRKALDSMSGKRRFKYREIPKIPIEESNGDKDGLSDERDIMNFFLTHKLNGEYIDITYEISPDEMDYKDERGILKHVYPDFLFPKYDIYLEHWAVDEDDISIFDGYEIGMNKKKQWFDGQDKYILFETRAFEYGDKSYFFNKLEERFLDALKKRYPDLQFEFTPIEYHELVTKVYKDCKAYVKKIPSDISKFVKIAKVNDFSPDDIRTRLDDESWLPIQKTFGKIAVNIYEKYQNELTKRKEIDYEEMINDAVEILKTNKEFYRDTFEHILIDEYQDISEQRYYLINELLKKNPSCKLFCVGDDWQSIMSFSGSNLDYFINFNDFFPNNEMTDLPINYRSNKSVVETGNEIIKHNSKKIAKETIANNKEEGKIQIFISNHEKEDFWGYYEEIAQNCLDDIQVLINSESNNHKPNDIKVLTRILSNPKLKEILLQRAKERNIPLYCPKDTNKLFPDKIPLMTVHGSKGLEAKTVFILDVCKGLYGFPCELEDSIIFNVAKKHKIDDKEAEERRLFYVAITRAKKDVIIYTQKSQESKFLNEISKYVSRTSINEKIIPTSNIKRENNENKKIFNSKKSEIKQKYSLHKRVNWNSRTCNYCNQVIPKELVTCPKCGNKLLPIIE